jgi:hypothetical protein
MPLFVDLVTLTDAAGLLRRRMDADEWPGRERLLYAICHNELPVYQVRDGWKVTEAPFWRFPPDLRGGDYDWSSSKITLLPRWWSLAELDAAGGFALLAEPDQALSMRGEGRLPRDDDEAVPTIDVRVDPDEVLKWRHARYSNEPEAAQQVTAGETAAQQAPANGIAKETGKRGNKPVDPPERIERLRELYSENRSKWAAAAALFDELHPVKAEMSKPDRDRHAQERIRFTKRMRQKI